MDNAKINRSIVSPLRIDAVAVPGTGGLIGMTICPGRLEHEGFGDPSGPWKRDLDLDLQVILEWKADALVTLIEDFEFELLDVPELPDKAREYGIRWMYLPIVDVRIPDEVFEEQWETAGAELRRILREGGRVVIHCRGGRGRTGLVAHRVRHVSAGGDPEGQGRSAGDHPDQGAGRVCQKMRKFVD